jgi:hypothetical protein
MKANDFKNARKLIDVLHEVANPSFEDPVAAKAIWEAVRVALEKRGMNYADIISGGVTIDLALEKMEQTNEA